MLLLLMRQARVNIYEEGETNRQTDGQAGEGRKASYIYKPWETGEELRRQTDRRTGDGQTDSERGVNSGETRKQKAALL